MNSQPKRHWEITFGCGCKKTVSDPRPAGWEAWFCTVDGHGLTGTADIHEVTP
jgi:hypothetical protein